jgi:hypothetical protein
MKCSCWFRRRCLHRCRLCRAAADTAATAAAACISRRRLLKRSAVATTGIVTVNTTAAATSSAAASAGELPRAGARRVKSSLTIVQSDNAHRAWRIHAQTQRTGQSPACPRARQAGTAATRQPMPAGALRLGWQARDSLPAGPGRPLQVGGPAPLPL